MLASTPPPAYTDTSSNDFAKETFHAASERQIVSVIPMVGENEVDVWVKMSLGQTIAATATVDVPEMIEMWDNNFEAPPNGWDPPSASWRIYVYDDLDHVNSKDDVIFEIYEEEEP